MLIVGEKINTSRKSIAEAVETGDAAFIVRIAREQVAAGAHFIDVNAGTFLKEEVDYLPWLVETVQGAVDIPLCLDSPNPEALVKALECHKGEPMINSISLEEDRFRNLLPVVTSQPCKVVALCMAQTSMPTTADERTAVASELIERLTKAGVALEKIYVDPLAQPVSVDVTMGSAVLKAIAVIMERFPGVNTICGLSNISYGLPARRLVNRTFLTLALAHGLSVAILDPTDKRLMANLLTSEMLLGHDEYCTNFIDAYQNGGIEDD
ncbi:MAG: methyltetrahydrofolate cobalamin methyltransferase [Deltaproteobacteria bacterium]|nr:methyltetrahydrofolate cobalamin methyltransferase [Deltaproteobacteria bacterium]